MYRLSAIILNRALVLSLTLSLPRTVHISFPLNLRFLCSVPYCFHTSFYTEVFSAYLNSVGAGIEGLVASISTKMILDVEFADDTALYMHAEEGNLGKAQPALEAFCVASSAKVSWCKSVGFLFSTRPLPSWRLFESFSWIQEGVSVRYLGM